MGDKKCWTRVGRPCTRSSSPSHIQSRTSVLQQRRRGHPSLLFRHPSFPPSARFLPTHASPGLCCEGTPLRVHHLQQRSAYLQARLGIADSYLSVLHHSLGTHIRAPALIVSDPSLACSLRASMSYQPTMAQPTLPKTGKVSSRRKGSSNPPVILRSYAEPRTSQDALERTQLVRFAQRSVAHTCWPSADRWTRLIRMSTTTSIPFMPVVLLQSHPP